MVSRWAASTLRWRAGQESVGRLLCQLPAGDQRQSGEGDPQDHPRLADGLDEEQSEARGLGSPEQPGGTRLDELLRAFLSVEVRSGALTPEQGPCALGATEIQTVQTPRASVDVLVGTHRATGARDATTTENPTTMAQTTKHPPRPTEASQYNRPVHELPRIDANPAGRDFVTGVRQVSLTTGPARAPLSTGWRADGSR